MCDQYTSFKLYWNFNSSAANQKHSSNIKGLLAFLVFGIWGWGIKKTSQHFLKLIGKQICWEQRFSKLVCRIPVRNAMESRIAKNTHMHWATDRYQSREAWWEKRRCSGSGIIGGDSVVAYPTDPQLYSDIGQRAFDIKKHNSSLWSEHRWKYDPILSNDIKGSLMGQYASGNMLEVFFCLAVPKLTPHPNPTIHHFWPLNVLKLVAMAAILQPWVDESSDEKGTVVDGRKEGQKGLGVFMIPLRRQTNASYCPSLDFLKWEP